MYLTLIIKYAKYIFIALLIAAGVWFYKDYMFQIEENKRQSENSSQLRKMDSTRFASQVLNAREIADYLQYDNKELKQKLAQDGIKMNRIESIVSQALNYRDVEKRSTDASKMIADIKNNVPSITPFTDSTKCLVNKGFIQFKNDSLKLVFTSRDFKNQSDAVAYWERRQWSFLGLKTRFLGRKEFTAKNYSDCGETKLMKIEKKPK